jgi:D-alanyl-D-alanine carboxypeptidase/D-alanyl-D-alanine-endopeptidase (penicillin-binding protein 4)
MAPASTQKIFTAIAVLDALGSGYRYKTEMGYTGEIKDSILKGDIIIVGYGDPSFGSWRYAGTKRSGILGKLVAAVRAAGINTVNGNIMLDDSKFSYQPVPGGWIWEDIGNYYGAGTWGINWNENQYDLVLKPGDKEGDETTVLATRPVLLPALNNLVTTGAKGSGDNAYIYLPPYGASGFAEGTVPAGEKRFAISGSIPYPADVLGKELQDSLTMAGIKLQGSIVTGNRLFNNKQTISAFNNSLFTYYSPALDSLVYWFLQKSINLYGEAFAKTIGYEKAGTGSTDRGVEVIRNFWQKNGIEKSSVKMMDGSGLSPQNRVTAAAEVAALQYAKTRPWFSSFYNALPMYNGTKMKSGTIGGAKAYAGYQTSAQGTEYTFSIIINNYDGDASSLIQKMYSLLDVLK